MHDLNSFENFYREHSSDVIMKGNYFGILKKECPKWCGWKIIYQYRILGYDVKDIPFDIIEIHIKNFYFIKYLEQKFY